MTATAPTHSPNRLGPNGLCYALGCPLCRIAVDNTLVPGPSMAQLGFPPAHEVLYWLASEGLVTA